MTPEMLEELIAVMDATSVSNCQVLIFRAAGDSFCSGLDLSVLQSMNDKTAADHVADAERIARLFRTLYELPKPTIAVVHGAAIAGGTGLATICDFTLAVPSAKFGYTEARIGFVPAIVSSFLLRQVGEKQARDLLLSGRIFDAKEALHLGLVTRIITHPQVLLREAYNQALCLLKNSPESMRWTKGLLSQHVSDALDIELANAARWGSRAKLNDDFREGIHAFLEKRSPDWPSLHRKTSRYQPV